MYSMHIMILKKFSLLLLLSAISYGLTPEGFTELKTGDKAPDFTLPGTDGKSYSLQDFSEPDVLMIYFTGTHCPTSNSIHDRFQQLLSDMKDKSFGVVAINPNHNDGMRPDEFSYSRYDESFEDSKRYAEDHGWTFPYLYDGEHQVVARAYGCLATPHVFIFDKERKLRYQGRFDNSRFPDPETVTETDARDAVVALLTGQEVKVDKTRPFGCSTKWREKKAAVAKDEANWKAIPVQVDIIDAAALKKLVKNGTGKLRMFNVWSTTCTPCVAEMPELAHIVRQFSKRNFELITLSMDAVKDQERVEKVLGKHHIVTSKSLQRSLKAEGRATNNYIYTGSDLDEFAQALDSQWPGQTPYTILVDQAGNIIYRKSGPIEISEVNDEILKVLKNTWQR